MCLCWKSNKKDDDYDSEKSIYENKDIKTIDDNEIYKILRSEIFSNNEYGWVYKAEMWWGYLMLSGSLLLLFFVFCYLTPQKIICECVSLTLSIVFLFIIIIFAFIGIFLGKRKEDSRISIRDTVFKVLDIGNSTYGELNDCIIDNIKRNIDFDKRFAEKAISAFSSVITVIGTLLLSLGCSLFQELFEPFVNDDLRNFVFLLTFSGVVLLLLGAFLNFVPNFIKNTRRFYSEEIVLAYKDAIFMNKVSNLNKAK